MTERSHSEATLRHNERLEAARARPMEHEPRLVTKAEIGEKVHGSGPVGQFNNRLAVLITRAVGTMWAAYAFVLLALVSLPQAAAAVMQGDTLTGVTWLSQSFLQLVLLPIIIVGQNVSSGSAEARAEADHETLTALQVMNARQLEILEQRGVR